jgi:hypothetical protein
VPSAPPPLPPLGPPERGAFDYADLDAAMRGVDEAVRNARRTLDRLAGRGAAPGPGAPDAPGDGPGEPSGDAGA